MRIVALENPEATTSIDESPDEVRLTEVFLAEGPLLRKIVAGMGLGGADAEDVLQVVSVKCLRESSAFADRRQCLRWLVRVTTNECITEHRRRRRFLKQVPVLLERSGPALPSGPVESTLSAERLEAVRAALRDLDDDLLRPLVLRYFGDLSSAEIGESLQLPASSVRSLLRKGRLALAKALTKRGIDR